MKSSNRRSRRQRNPRKKENREQPFFSKANDTSTVQTKKEEAFFQPKLKIGQPGDRYEKEADSIAENVVNRTGNGPAVQRMGGEELQRVALSTPMEDEKLGTAEERMREDQEIQEKPEEEEMQMQQEEEEEAQMQGEEEEEMQMQQEEEEEARMQGEEEGEEMQMQQGEEEEAQMQGEEEEEMQTKGDKDGSPHVASHKLSKKVKNARGKGRPIPEQTRKKMEASFGVDLSSVRIHTGKEAEETCQALNAQAFTIGKDIFFNNGKFNPENSSGERLLAHELTHVIQQKGENDPSLRKQEASQSPALRQSTKPGKGRDGNEPRAHRARRSWIRKLLGRLGFELGNE